MDEATREELERTVARLWSEVFTVEGIAESADFFRLGGDSVLGVQLVRKLNLHFAIQLNVVAIFQFPTVRELAAHVGRLRLESGRPVVPEVDVREILI